MKKIIANLLFSVSASFAVVGTVISLSIISVDTLKSIILMVLFLFACIVLIKAKIKYNKKTDKAA